MDTTEIAGRTREADIEALGRVVATVQHAQQNELVGEFVGLFRPDAVWTTGHGRLLIGRDEIAAFTEQVLPGAMTDLTVTFEVVHVLFIRPDVAAVKVRQRYLGRDGQPAGGDSEGTPLFVMARDEGQWRLAACQNTGVLAS